MKVFVSACGEGLGHTSRMLALFRALKAAGHEVRLAGYGKSLEVLRGSDPRALETFPELRMAGAGGSFNIVSSILRSSGTPLDITRSYMLEKKAIEGMGADAVVSDSRLSTVLAGERAGRPTFYVTNQSEFKMEEIPRSSRLRAFNILTSERLRIPGEAARRLIDAPLSVPYGFSDRVLVPDFRPPDAVCLPLISRDLGMRKKTFFTGPMNGLCFCAPKPAKWETRKRKVLVSFGGQAFREGMQDAVAQAASKIPGHEFIVAGMVVKKDADFGSVRMRRFLPDLMPYAAAADFLVIPGGHSSIMESIILRKPALVIPDNGQAEQESNAKTYQKLGLGRMLRVDSIRMLGSALKRLEAGAGAHRAALEALSERARGAENGGRNAAHMIEEYVERIGY
jgi:UDP:flavonoid glycosyltransferase YjiC (YdhE family)